MTDLYVTPSGSEVPDGSLANPFNSISKAFNIAKPGDNILLRAGTYRERIDTFASGIESAPITLQAYQNEKVILKGSDVVTGWEFHSGNIWKKTGWHINSQQVFVDFDKEHKLPLKQIGRPGYNYDAFRYPTPNGTSFSDITAGSFFYNTTEKVMYVWLEDGSDPNQHVMELSTRIRILFIAGSFVNVSGIEFYHSSTAGEQGAAVELGNGSVITNCTIQYTDFCGLQMGYLKSNSKAFDCDVSHNGNSGVNAAGTKNFIVSNVTMNHNNHRNFNPLWHAGGFKAAADAYGVVEKCEAAFNTGSGIWFDYCNSGSLITVRDNNIHDNSPKEAGVFIEVGKNTKVYGNKITNSSRRGVYISGSDDCEIYNNVISGLSGYSAIELDGMPRAGATLSNNYIHDNVIEKCTTGYDLYIIPDELGVVFGNRSDRNNISRVGAEPIFYYNGIIKGLKNWQTATGYDMNSISGGVLTPPVDPTPVPEEPTPVEPDPVDPTPVPTEPSPVDPVNITIAAKTVSLIDLVNGGKYTGVVDMRVLVTSDDDIDSTALYINGALLKRVKGGILDYEWDTNILTKNRSYIIYISSFTVTRKLKTQSLKVYIE